MKGFMLRLFCATAITLGAVALGASGAQPRGQNAAGISARQADPAPVASQQQQQNEGQIPASGEVTTQEAKAFSGRIVKENGRVVLKDPVTKVIYKLDDPAKAKPYLGKPVKVTGKLDMNSNTIQVESIEALM